MHQEPTNSTFNPLIFRDYDIRGIYNQDFNNDFPNKIAKAIHQFFPTGPIVLSRDLRLSGIQLLSNMQDTLTNLGRHVINIGHNPTPILYYAICKEQAIAGIQITASHKGKEWNGFKVNAANAAPIDAQTGIYQIRDIITKNCSVEGIAGANLPKPQTFDRAIPSDLSEQSERTRRSANCGPAPWERSETFNTENKIIFKNYTNKYIQEITDKITINPKHNKSLKVVIDTGNGSVGLILEKILLKLGVHAITINSEFDDSFPNHQADPLKDENLVQLQAAVTKHRADLGIALDGDGDRCGIVDELGQVVSRDKTLMLLSKDALDLHSGHCRKCMGGVNAGANQIRQSKPNRPERSEVEERNPWPRPHRAEQDFPQCPHEKAKPIVTEVRASMAYLDYIKANGGTPVIAKAGHSFILRKVVETNAVFGGELTGHMYFPKEFYNFDDGIFTAVKLTQILSNLPTTLSEHLKTLPEYLPSKEYHIKADDETKFQKIKKLQELVKQEGKDFLDIDGLRITYPNIGWLLIRASNTGPTIKCRFEAKTEDNYNFLKLELERLLNAVDLVLE
jgi:phosphomannomutase / phosphoglucomutase